ncbi:Transcription factor bHLH140 [Linum perenne]
MDVDGEDATKPPEVGDEKRICPIVVILVGAPGSGKSTFCDHVMRSSTRSWTRVCQDTINNGKAGTKPQCLKSAATALKEGKSVFIDRCNLDREQRSEFVKLDGAKKDVHAVVLDLPAQVCISRSVKRTGHEGNLQGGKAAAVVNRMLQKKELPQLNEGFCRITFCQNETEIDAAIKMYSALGPEDSLPDGCFGQKTQKAKVQLGIMKFLKKVDVSANEDSKPLTVQNPAPNLTSKEINTCPKGQEITSSLSELATKPMQESRSPQKVSCKVDASLGNVPTLAFPSISTSDFQFDSERASDIIVEKAEEFVNKLGNARLVLVDLSHRSKILSLVKSKAAQRNIDQNKFFTFVGDITKLYSQGGLKCNVIANAANWRLKPGGGGVNAAIFSAAGPSLEVATKECAKSLQPGHAVLVPLPSESPLYSKEGVTHVIHVLGPNMNPQRPDCLNHDYTKGCRVLREAYTSLFEAFASVAKTWITSQNSESLTSEQKNKRDGECDFEMNKRNKGLLQHQAVSSSRSAGENKEGRSKSWGSWAHALYDIAMHPEKPEGVLLEACDDFVVLNDQYPKAKKHLLVVTRHRGLDQLADANEEHIQQLSTMHSAGMKWAERFLQEDPSLVFRLGYHSEPSMRQLHLHVISQDLDSSHLKNKKHWNSFTTPFFRDSIDVMDEIRNHGKAKLENDEKHLSMELRCHRCRSAHPNIPKLKSHIKQCRAPFPSHLLEKGRLVGVSYK